jgi:hypothetical protein
MMRLKSASALVVTLGAVALAGCSTVALDAPKADAPKAAASPAQTAQITQAAQALQGQVRSMLWVGNSFFYYNNSMHGHVAGMLNAAGIRGHRASSATISGSGINWHDMAAHFKPGAVGSYTFMGDNSVRFNAFDKPGDRLFDATIMMDCSQCPVHPQLKPVFHEFTKKHSATVRQNKAEPIFFMSWAYQDEPSMTQTLAAEYIAAGKANNALVVPAGLAFAESIKLRPDLNLYEADKRHPSLMGTYLASAVVLASVYKINPIGNPYTGKLPADVVAHLQKVAFETSQAFHAKEGRGSL